jgi:hypothetical protein
MHYLDLMFYCQVVVDALLDFLQNKKVEKLKEKMESAADLMVWLGAGLVPEFKEIADSWRKGGKKWPNFNCGDGESPLRHEHYLIFEKMVKKGGYKDKLEKIRQNLLSLNNPIITFDAKKGNAETCLFFFGNLFSACHYAFRQEFYNL